MKALLLVMALTIFAPALAMAQGQEVSWEAYFRQAEQALEQNNYWEAKKIFNISLDYAERTHEDVELAQRLENLAESYAIKHRPRVAEVLHRKAIEIFSKNFGADHNLVVQSIQKFLRVLRNVNHTDTARKPENRCKDILASSQG